MGLTDKLQYPKPKFLFPEKDCRFVSVSQKIFANGDRSY